MKPPFTLAVVNLKGGVGKTTTAVSLAHLFGEHAGPTMLLDLDRQASAYAWAGDMDAAGEPLNATAAQVPPDAPPARLARMVADVSAGYEWLIIDSPPGDLDRADAAIEAVAANGGVVIIPTGTTDVDLPRAVVTLDDIGDRAPCFVLLTKTRANTIATRTARTDLTDAGAIVLDAEIPLRETIANAATRGLTEAAALYMDAAEELLDRCEQVRAA